MAVIAFPGALGFGKNSFGGSGRHLGTPATTIYHVTSLSDSYPNPPAGTLRYGIETLTGPRTIVFDIGGIITLVRDIRITSPYVTIAGQTAPGNGVLIRNAGIYNTTHNIIGRFLTIRAGDGQYTDIGTVACTLNGTTTVTGATGAFTNVNPNDYVRDDTLTPSPHPVVPNGPGSTNVAAKVNNEQITLSRAATTSGPYNLRFIRGTTDPDALRCLHNWGPVHDVIYDHLSLSWGIDTTTNLGNGGTEITWQYCFITEPLDLSYHPEVTHGFCLNLSNTSATGAQVSQILNFFAHMKGRAPRVDVPSGQFEFLNNVVYDWGIDGGALRINQANAHLKYNYFLNGLESGSTKLVSIGGLTYVLGNLGSGRTDLTQSEWLITDSSESNRSLVEIFSGETPPLLSPTEARDLVLARAGDRPLSRNAVDTRLVSEYNAGTGVIIDSQSDVGGYPDSTAYPTVVSAYVEPEDPDEVASNGYTNLENDLNGLAEGLIYRSRGYRPGRFITPSRVPSRTIS